MDTTLDSQFTTEYQLLEEYHRKRRPRARPRAKPAVLHMGAPGKMRRRKSTEHRCQGVQQRAFSASTETGKFGNVADNLAHIVASAPLVEDDLETDSNEGVIQRLVELLKESGDELNEKIQKDHELLGYLQRSFSYSVFEKLVSAFVGSVKPSHEQNDVGAQRTRIAWTFEMTSRLGALDLQPMNRVMGFGAQYLHKTFAPWIQQHGGWENVFNGEGTDDDD